MSEEFGMGYRVINISRYLYNECVRVHYLYNGRGPRSNPIVPKDSMLPCTRTTVNDTRKAVSRQLYVCMSEGVCLGVFVSMCVGVRTHVRM